MTGITGLENTNGQISPCRYRLVFDRFCFHCLAERLKIDVLMQISLVAGNEFPIPVGLMFAGTEADMLIPRQNKKFYEKSKNIIRNSRHLCGPCNEWPFSSLSFL